MKIAEATPGRMVLHHRGLLSEIAVILFMALFGGLAWIVFPVDYPLAMALLGCAILGGLLFLVVSVRTTIIFDRIHNIVLIRQKTLLRTHEREVRLSDVAAAMLLPDGKHRADRGGIIALALRTGDKAAVPLTPEPVGSRVSDVALGAINGWLERAGTGVSPLRA